MSWYPGHGSAYGGGSTLFYPSTGGYDLGGVWRPHTGRNEMVFDSCSRYYPDGREMYFFDPHEGFHNSAYDPALHHHYYRSPMDYYGAYHSLMMYEEQLRMMHDITEAERLALWQQRLQFEELCEEERALQYALMAEEERMRLGLLHDSYWASRYGNGYDSFEPSILSSYISPWDSYRLPLSSSLISRFGPLYGRGGRYLGDGLGRTRHSGYSGSTYGVLPGDYSHPLGISRSHSSSILRAHADEARRLRRHARENARQARRLLRSY